MADGSITIDTNLDGSGVKKGISGLKTSLEKIGSIAASALQKVTIATGAVAAGFAGIVTASVQARGELEQQIGGTEAVFKEFAEGIQKTAEAAYSTMGLSANDYMATINKMGALMQGSGLDIQTSMNLSSQAMQRAADIASIMGIDTASAMESIAGAAKGNFTMMDNLGVAMNATTIEAYAMSKGIKTSYAEMENAQKVQLAMEMFLERTTYAIGNYTKENETFAGSLSTMKASIQNFLSGAGDISSVINSVLSFTQITLQSINEVVPSILENLTVAMPQIAEAGNQILNSLLSGITGNQELIITSTTEILNSLLNIIIEFLPQILQMGIEVVQSLVNGIQQSLPQIVTSIVSVVTIIITALVDMLPQILEIGIQAILQLITGISKQMPELISKILDCTTSMVTTLLDMMPQLLELGIQVIVQLILGIAKQMPKLIPQIVECVLLIVDTLIDNLDLLVDAGIELLLAIILGIVEALPKLIEKTPEIINKFFDAIMRNLPKLISAGVQIIIMLITGLINAIPSLIGQIPNLIQMVLNTFSAGFKSMTQIGVGIVTGLWEGLQSSITWLANKISGWCSTIIGGIKAFFGIHSPSRLFRDEIGENLGLGIGEGFEDSLDSVYSNMEKAVDKQNAKLTSNLTSQHQIQVINEDNRQSTLSSIDNNREIQVNSTIELDGKEVAKTVNRVNAREKLQYGLS